MMDQAAASAEHSGCYRDSFLGHLPHAVCGTCPCLYSVVGTLAGSLFNKLGPALLARLTARGCDLGQDCRTGYFFCCDFLAAATRILHGCAEAQPC